MKKNINQKLMMIATMGLSAAGIIFICLSIFNYERTWTSAIAVVCVMLSMLFQVIFRQRNN